MGAPINMTGHKYGRLTVLELHSRNKHGQRIWRCLCDCGAEAYILGYVLRNGGTRSCGCLNKESIGSLNKKHGMAKSPIWNIHRSMMARCYSKNSFAYNRYGARGISVCERWHDFENFYADMGHRPEGMSLERIDNDKCYCPENVKWGTATEQANNRCSNRFIEHDGQTLTTSQWARYANMKVGTLYRRLSLGIPIEEALLPGNRRFKNVISE